MAFRRGKLKEFNENKLKGNIKSSYLYKATRFIRWSQLYHITRFTEYEQTYIALQQVSFLFVYTYKEEHYLDANPITVLLIPLS